MNRITRSTLTAISAVLALALPVAGQQEGEAEELIPNPDSAMSEAPLEFGVDDVGYTTVYGHDLVVTNSTTRLQFVNDGAYCAVNEQPNLLNAYLRIPQMPEGAEVVAVRLWGEDTSSTHSLRVCMTQVCYPVDAAGAGDTTFPGCLATTGSGGHQYITIGNTQTINNRDCHYLAQVRFNYDGTQNGNPPCVGDDVKFQRLRLDWRRRVSPAPPFATFDDVPTGHLFYQYIEALAASGVTGGCGGGGNYCPDAPLTRGQMAVFLAKALGLHWGHPTP